jgi:hypothetical protein
MSRFNQLYLADANSVIEELEDRDATVDELRIALINALGMIAKLQADIQRLKQNEHA